MTTTDPTTPAEALRWYADHPSRVAECGPLSTTPPASEAPRCRGCGRADGLHRWWCRTTPPAGTEVEH